MTCEEEIQKKKIPESLAEAAEREEASAQASKKIEEETSNETLAECRIAPSDNPALQLLQPAEVALAVEQVSGT
jgi:hypothetical protein